MSTPLSPPPAEGPLGADLPAYLSNGLIGLRVRDLPLTAGMALINGYVGEHPVRRIEAGAVAPYPLAGDIQVDGVWLSDSPHQAACIDQAYDFGTGELTTRFRFQAGPRHVEVSVLTFCDRHSPTIVCQEITVEVDAACDVTLRAAIDARHAEGRALRQMRDTPGEDEPSMDGSLHWESAGALGYCGFAYVTELLGASDAERSTPPIQDRMLFTDYGFRAGAGRRYRVRQIVSMVSGQDQPDLHAVRLVALAADEGFDAVRAASRACWVELWKGRIVLHGADERWQRMADAGLFYLLSSTSIGSPASTSIFGLATWLNYHYYFGHVMWDIETFIVPVLSLLQPEVAGSLLEYRSRNLEPARINARLRGRRGVQFPWESSPSTGQEAAPIPGTAAWHEDHISLDVALGFARHAHLTGDQRFLREKAWPVLSGVADWIVGRVSKTRSGYAIRASMGIAEREQAVDNPAFSVMSAVLVLREAEAAASRLGLAPGPEWGRVAAGLTPPMRDKVVISHDGYRIDEEKGATPDPLMGVFPLAYPLDDAVVQATLDFYLDQAADYLGSPMLSALYGVWAARTGDRRLSLKMMEDGYGRFSAGRFLQTLEYRTEVFPEQPRAGPFFANIGGFLSGLLFGFTGVEPDAADPAEWAQRPVVLPHGWEAIEVERVWIHGRPCRLVARQGQTAELIPA